ncbi:MAG TPA: hypothetical protein DEA26_10750 [Oceanospirillales bacterium]|nr:hypothetical protein [Oceanospirillaceae bacterium]HBS43151.1 hypothetical protein [Oceanospirillales bacterium]
MSENERPETTGSNKTRKYDNRNRQAQSAQTREAILDALSRQLLSNNTPDFSIDQVAQETGITTRTVFRHFPNKDSMLEALSERVLEITGQVAIPDSPEAFNSTIYETFGMMEEHSALMRTLLLSELGRGVRSRMRERRRKGNTDALQALVSDLPVAQSRAVSAVLVHLISAESWWQLHDHFGIPAKDAADSVAWIYKLVGKALSEGEFPDENILRKSSVNEKKR